jgi:hypothetical protein
MYVCMYVVPLGYTPRRHTGGAEVQLYSFLTSMLHAGERNITPWPIYPREKENGPLNRKETE